MNKYLGIAALVTLLSTTALAAEITAPVMGTPSVPGKSPEAPATPPMPGAPAAKPAQTVATMSVPELTTAAEKGNVEAQFALAEHYGQRNSLDADYSIAQKWYEKAANAGNHDAQYKLGLMYQDAMGVSQSLPAAYYWISLAASGGNKMYNNTKAELEKKVPPEAAAAIKQKVDAFKPSTGDAPAAPDAAPPQ